MFERLLFGVENDQPIWGKILSVGALSFFKKTPFGDFFGGPIFDKEMVCSTWPRITNQTQFLIHGRSISSATFSPLVTDQSGVLPFYLNETDQSSVSRTETEQNQTY